MQKYEQQFGYKETSEAPRRVVYTLGDSETPRRVVYTPGDSEAPRRVVYMVGDSEAPRRVVYTAGGSGYYPASAKDRNRGEGGKSFSTLLYMTGTCNHASWYKNFT